MFLRLRVLVREGALCPHVLNRLYSEQPQRYQTQQPTRRQLRLTIHPPTSKTTSPSPPPDIGHGLAANETAVVGGIAITISYDSSQQQAKRKILTGGLDGAVGLHHIGFGYGLR